MSKKDMVTVIGAKVKEGKKQHLSIGQSYDVTADMADAMIKNGQAKKK